MIKNIFVNYLQRIWARVNIIYFTFVLRLYFKRWQINNYPKMGRRDPVIYVANHQNAFLDAFSIIFSQKRQPIFLVRANIFSTPLARFLLRTYNMFPVHRQRDGGDTIAKNEKVIQDCIDILKDGRQPIAIFVEGNHNMMRSLRPIKKGVARIAFSAMEQGGFKMNLKIIPIGLAYSKHTHFRSDLLVNFGEPLIMTDYLDLYHENPNKAYLQITKDISEELSKIVVNISDRDNYEEIEKAWISEKIQYNNMADELINDQQIIARLSKEKAQGKTLEERKRISKKKSVIPMILGFPAFVYGAVNNLPLYFIMNRFISKMVTDIHFYGSLKVGGGAIIGIILYIIQAIAVYTLTGSNVLIAAVYFISLPFFGIFAYDYYRKYYTDEPHTSSSADFLKDYK